MLAASICLEVYYTVLPSTTMTSRVPRCLFGKPNPQETIDMLQDALDAERSKFARRWGVDPCSEDKENNYRRRNNNEKSQSSPNKKRSHPYSRQTSIHGEQHFANLATIRRSENAYGRGICTRRYRFMRIQKTSPHRKYVKVSHAKEISAFRVSLVRPVLSSTVSPWSCSKNISYTNSIPHAVERRSK